MDIKNKRLVTIKILIDKEKDAFGIDTFFQGFENNNPSILERLTISRILDLVKKQIEDDLEEVNIPNDKNK